jgi:hypothetical protein
MTDAEVLAMYEGLIPGTNAYGALVQRLILDGRLLRAACNLQAMPLLLCSGATMTDTTYDNRASSASPPAGAELDPDTPIETAEQLRIAIDQGNSKVDAGDPAAAPLGTDDEAGGTPNSAAQVRLAAAHEIRPYRKRQWTSGLGHAWWLIGFTVFMSASILASAFWVSG